MVKPFQVLFLCFTFLFVAMVPVNADEPMPEFYVTFTQADEQGLYQAVVSISNNPGIAAYNLLMEYDSTMLTPVSISEGAILQGMVFTSNVAGADEERLAELNGVTAVWASAENDTGNGVVYTVLFRVNPYATGVSQLNLVSRGIGNADEEIVDFVLRGAVVDINGDAVGISGEVNDGGFGVVAIVIASVVVVAGSVVTVLVIRNRNQQKQTGSRYHERGLGNKR